MSLRDELAKAIQVTCEMRDRDIWSRVIGIPEMAAAVVRVFSRYLAAERAAIVEELAGPLGHLCNVAKDIQKYGCAPNTPLFGDKLSQALAAWEKYESGPSRDRSALDALLAQARAEQRKKDASYLEWLAAQWTPASHPHAVLKQAAAAIRGQKD